MLQLKKGIIQFKTQFEISHIICTDILSLTYVSSSSNSSRQFSRTSTLV